MNDTINHAEGARLSDAECARGESFIDLEFERLAAESDVKLDKNSFIEGFNAHHRYAARSPHTPEAVEESVNIATALLHELEKDGYIAPFESAALQVLINAAKENQ